MNDKDKVPINWVEEQKKLEEEYKRKLAELKKLRQDNEMIGKILTRGILPTLVLNIVFQQPSNGNEISTRIGDITDGSWQPSTGGIYPILKRYENQGLITGKWDDPDKRVKKIYTITDKGLKELTYQKQALINSLNKTVDVFNNIIKNLK
ncbi:lineage-specific thermal regulator protein [Oxobacter pfennigii]|uniref:Lineage-specific thermal regulator protein n=1 Tax=Oxobacter pfennigii TaxID=36849 RepID=A0A0P9AE77_9CLOT|nr:PadR family transcriptional regulator [Oxobacter pfennigii]KPU43589.1 lineage-specific thermal regulator protein [Oxobacter pfennigii]